VAYQQDPRTATRVIRGEAVIITNHDQRIHVLDAVATEIWQLCSDEPVTAEVLCDRLLERYEGQPDAIRSDVETLLEQLVGMGALQRIEGGPTSQKRSS
jgi:hypothetical protein